MQLFDSHCHIDLPAFDADRADVLTAARAAGVAIMPECGLDPGIDLVLYGMAREKFSELHLVNSYCGGLPEARAANNPLKYKVSWNWEGVLSSSKRDARAILDGTAGGLALASARRASTAPKPLGGGRSATPGGRIRLGAPIWPRGDDPE